MQSEKVSIVVPVYNAEEHINLFMDSLLSQTYDNIEIILVNDGSTDRTLEIINSYKKHYPNIIKIINKLNGGVAETRNKGIEYVTGKYIMFADDDDKIEPNYIEEYVKANDNDYDIIIGGYIRKTYEGKTLFTRKLENKVLSPYIQLASWGKLYKTEYIKENKFKFLNTAIADDFYFNIFAYQNAKIKIIDNLGYHWMFNEKSLSNTDSKKMNRAEDLIITLNKIKKDLKPKSEEIMDYFYLRTVIYYILFSCKKVDMKRIGQVYDKLFDWLEKNTKEYNKNKYIKLKTNEGEQKTVKIIINLFMKLKKIHLIKPLIYIYSKI